MQISILKSQIITISYFLIVAQICFNYLQQQFYLVTPSMKALAKGKNEEVILKLLKNLVGATQGNFHETFLDDEGIRDIADVI